MKAKKTTALALGTMIVVSNGIPVFAKSNTSSVLVANVSNDMIEKTIDNVSNLILDNINAIEINETKPQEEVSYTYVQQEPIYVYTVEETVSEPVNMSVEEFLSIFDVEEPAVVDTSIEQAAYEQALANYNEALAAYEAASQVVETTKEVEVEVTEETIDDEGNVIETTYTEIQTVTETSTAGDVDTAKANLDVAKTVLDEAQAQLEAGQNLQSISSNVTESANIEDPIIVEESQTEEVVNSTAQEQSEVYYSDIFYKYQSHYLSLHELNVLINETTEALNTVYGDYCDSSDFKWTSLREQIKAATDFSELFNILRGEYEDARYEDVLSKINVKIFENFNSISKTISDTIVKDAKLIKAIKAIFDAHSAYEDLLSPYTEDEIFADVGTYSLMFYKILDNELLIDNSYYEKLNDIFAKTSDYFKTLSQPVKSLKIFMDTVKTVYAGVVIETIRKELIQEIIDLSDDSSIFASGMQGLLKDIEMEFPEYIFNNYVNDIMIDKFAGMFQSYLTQGTLIGVVQDVVSVIDTLVFDLILDIPDLPDILKVNVYNGYVSGMYRVLEEKIRRFDNGFKSSEIEEFEELMNLMISLSKTALTESESISISKNIVQLQDAKQKWEQMSWNSYLDAVRDDIENRPDEDRHLKSETIWTLLDYEDILPESNELESGDYLYVNNGYLYGTAYTQNFDNLYNSNYTPDRASVNTGDYTVKDLTVTGDLKISAELTVSEGTVWHTLGNLTVYGIRSSSIYQSLLINNGTIVVDGDFEDNGQFVQNVDNAKLYLAGNYNIKDGGTTEITEGLIIFNGREQQEIKKLTCRDIEVINPAGIKYLSDTYVTGNYNLHGNPLDIGSYYTYISDRAYLSDNNNDDFGIVRVNGSYTVWKDMVIHGQLFINYIDEFTIPEDFRLTITNDLIVSGHQNTQQNNFSKMTNDGVLKVGGNFILTYNGQYYQTNENAQMNVGGNFTIEDNGKLYLEEGTVVFDGIAQQEIKGLNARNIEVSNPNGIKYLTDTYVTGNYNLHGNPLDSGTYYTYISDQAYLSNNEGDYFGPVHLKDDYIVLDDMVINGALTVENTGSLTIPEGICLSVTEDVNIRGSYNTNIGQCGKITNDDQLKIGGDFTLGYNADFYQTNEDAQMNVGGNFTGEKNSRLNLNEGTVVFDGTQQQEIMGLSARNIEVVNPAGIKYLSDTYVTGNYDLHGNPLDLQTYYTYLSDKAYLSDNEGDVFGEVRLSDENYIVPKNMTIHGNLYVGPNQTLIIPEGIILNITGDLTASGWSYYSRYANVNNSGILNVSGMFSLGNCTNLIQKDDAASVSTEHLDVVDTLSLWENKGKLIIHSVDEFNELVSQLPEIEEATVDTRFEVYDLQALYDALTSYEKTLVGTAYQQLKAVADKVSSLMTHVEYMDILYKDVSTSENVVSVPLGGASQLTIHIDPMDATEQRVVWTSSNPDIVSVDENGIVHALAEGSAAIYAKAIDGGITVSCQIEVGQPVVTDAKHSLALEGNIGVNFFYALSDEVLADTEAKVEFDLEGTTVSYVIKNARSRTISGKRYKAFTMEATSVQMASDISAKVILSNGDTVFEETYSVKKYCDDAIADSDSETDLTRLMKALLTYGGYAQVFFDHDTDNLAYKDLESHDVSDVTAQMYTPYIMETAGSEEGLTYSYSTLALDSLTTINHIFTLGAGHTIDEYEFKMGDQVIKPIKRGSRYYVQIPNIASNNLDEAYTITCGGFEIRYSALSYAQKVVSATDGVDDLKSLMQAMYRYNEAANAYFG